MDEESSTSVSTELARQFHLLSRDLDLARDDCAHYVRVLTRWAMFWRSLGIGLGALVAAHAAITRIVTDPKVVEGSFVVIGILVVLVASAEATFKPALRAPKFAQRALEYEQLARRVRLFVATEHTAGHLGDSERDRLAAQLKQFSSEYYGIRKKENALYISGARFPKKRLLNEATPAQQQEASGTGQ